MRVEQWCARGRVREARGPWLGVLGVTCAAWLAACSAGEVPNAGGMDGSARDGAADGSPPADAGPREDTGMPPPPDTGTPTDAGADAGPAGDAGMTAICDRCVDHAECGPLARCIELSGGTRVCAPTCVPDIPTCGRGFQCIRNFAVSEDLTVCVPVGERCCVDEDGDDYGQGAGCDGLDCDDAVETTHPMAREECNGVDDDCDGNVDMPLAMGACDGGRMCVDGACRCPDGLTDCADGGCVDTDTDLEHCGTCATACPASPEGTAACSGGVCGTACGEACSPYACDGSSGLCFDMCRTDAECATGYVCAMGVCRPGPGTPCEDPSDCASGFCADGFCCRERCDGICEACNLPTREGYCDPVPAGDDSAGDCPVDDIATCDRDGTCDGRRRCALYGAGRVCTPPTCMGAMSRRASHCDGFGNCEASTSDACPPYVCDPLSGMCNVSCDDDADCIAGYACALGVCRRSRGQPCMLDSECASGFCTDGVCCEARCDGECERCDASGRIGYCDAVPAGDDPDAECATSQCGTTGVCSGMRACTRHMMGDVCGVATCMSGTVSNLPDVCGPGETCVDAGVRNCAPGTCDATTGLCRTSCMTTAQCAANHTCISGQCLANDGEMCAADGECVNNHCCSGICRNTTNDPSNCGACGTVCSNGHGSTSCSGSLCQPVCSPAGAWGNCDGNRVNGCETDLHTLSSCGGCGTSCALPNAGESCSTGSCLITSCSAGYSHCDSSQANGCEVSHASYTGGMCGSATDVGTYDGDRSCGFICGSNTGWDLFATRSGNTSAWFKARVREDSDCPTSIEHRVRLDVPADADYDLYLWRNCSSPAASSVGLTGVDESATIGSGDSSGSDDSFDYWIEVRWYSGSTCSAWTLYFEGHNC